MINFLSSGLTVTMSVANTLDSFTVTPASLVVHDTNTYTISINHAVAAHALNDYALITFPDLIAVPASPSCSASSGTVTCSQHSASVLKAIYATTPGDVVQFTITSLVNYDLADLDVTFSVEVFDLQDYLMEKDEEFNVTFTEAQIASVSTNNDDNIALGEVSNITLTITNGFSISNQFDAALAMVEITIPPEFTIGTECTTTSGSCAPVSASIYRVTNVGHTLTNMNVTMKDMLINYFDPISSTFKVVYSYNGYNISVLETGITISPYCDSPCQRCDGTKTACQSCLPTPNTLIYYDTDALDCLSECISGKYPDDTNECQVCNTPCSTCLDEENCTACVSSTWLYEQRCVTVCPDTYYNHSAGVCESCQSPCGLCTTLTSCETCVTGYLTNS